MYAMIIEETGSPEVLQYAEVPTPEPQPEEVLIQQPLQRLNTHGAIIIRAECCVYAAARVHMIYTGNLF